MMNVHRLAALSMSAVIFAACSGGSTQAPAASSNTSTAAGRKPNSVLKLQFPTNLISVKNTSSSARKPKFIDPNTSNLLYVTAYPSTGGSIQVLSDVPISSGTTDALGDVSIPLYLPPGTDEIVVQEFTSYGGPSAGYLLAQGDVTGVSISENQPNTPSIPMTLVLGTKNNQSGIAIINDLVNPTHTSILAKTPTLQPTYTTACAANGGTVYFVPVDENGFTAYAGTNGFGANFGGVPTVYSVSPLSTMAPAAGSTSSVLVQGINGGYTVAYDSNGDSINVTVTFTDVLLDPSGPVSGTIGTSASQNGYVNISGCP